MNKGSKRITIRIGDDLLELIDLELERRLLSHNTEPWNRSDFVMQAIAEKLSKAQRGRSELTQVRQEKVDPYRPRIITDE